MTRVVLGNADDIPTLRRDSRGVCRPAMYRGSNATFYQASAAVDGGGTVVSTAFGNDGDRPVQNGRHRSTQAHQILELRRPGGATFYTRDDDDQGPADAVTVSSDPLGDATDVGFQLGYANGPFGVYRPSNSTFFIQTSTSATVQQFGTVGDQGLVGAWITSPDPDQPDSVGVFRAAQGRWFLGQRAIDNDGSRQAPQTDVYSFSFGSPGDAALACNND